jgi:hypothetical protein
VLAPHVYGEPVKEKNKDDVDENPHVAVLPGNAAFVYR